MKACLKQVIVFPKIKGSREWGAINYFDLVTFMKLHYTYKNHGVRRTPYSQNSDLLPLSSVGIGAQKIIRSQKHRR